jgi:hypothetical protein
MRADGGTDGQVPGVIARRRDVLPVQAHDFSCPVGHVVEGVGVRAGDPVAEEVVRIIQILLHIPVVLKKSADATPLKSLGFTIYSIE